MKQRIAHQSRGREPADTPPQCHQACAWCSDGRAFSLVEMMIAIVILGLGLIMVATMFPVAWDRARTLSEHTIEQSTTAAARATLEALLRPAGVRMVAIKDPSDGPPFEEPAIHSGSLAGDLFYDRQLAKEFISENKPEDAFCSILLYSDTRVHALNMWNVRLSNGQTVAEDPWRLEQVTNLLDPAYPPCDDPEKDVNLSDRFRQQASFYFPQVNVADRSYPPLDDRWRDLLSNRKFFWAALHRLRQPAGPARPRTPPAITPEQSLELVVEAAAAIGSTRNFDLYYVTLRRTQSTHRYARQNDQLVPDPYKFERPAVPVSPAALNGDNDVLLPVAWRVQVELPSSLAYRSAPDDSPKRPTHVPSEIRVPPDTIAGKPAAMLVSMFPSGTTFVDELEGHIYRVTRRRIVDANGEKAVLTLDREIVQEDIDISEGDPHCEECTDSDWNNPPDPEELLRSVWVFPPPVDRTLGSDTVLFDGPSPVVAIEVRTLSISPPS